MRSSVLLLGMVMIASIGCTKKGAGSADGSGTIAGSGSIAETATSAGSEPAILASRGKSAYVANCSACHNLDPRKDGAVGPAVAGASLALLERRVLFGDYPPDYQPKRQSRLMVALPHLKDQLPALHAYLSAP
jgi:mono/diheme cytochrome c family protein